MVTNGFNLCISYENCIQQICEVLAAAESIEQLLSDYITASEPGLVPYAALQKCRLRILKRGNYDSEEYRKTLRKLTNMLG